MYQLKLCQTLWKFKLKEIKKICLFSIGIVLISSHSYAQSITPTLYDVKKLFKVLSINHKLDNQLKFQSTKYFELYFDCSDGAFLKSDTIRLFTDRSKVEWKDTLGDLTIYNNGLLGISKLMGERGLVTAFRRYESKNILNKEKVFPRYRIFEQDNKIHLLFDINPNIVEGYELYNIFKLDFNNYIFELKRINN